MLYLIYDSNLKRRYRGIGSCPFLFQTLGQNHQAVNSLPAQSGHLPIIVLLLIGFPLMDRAQISVDHTGRVLVEPRNRRVHIDAVGNRGG